MKMSRFLSITFGDEEEDFPVEVWTDDVCGVIYKYFSENFQHLFRLRDFREGRNFTSMTFDWTSDYPTDIFQRMSLVCSLIGELARFGWELKSPSGKPNKLIFAFRQQRNGEISNSSQRRRVKNGAIGCSIDLGSNEMFLLLPQAAPLESVYQRALKHSSIRDLIASSAAAATEVCNEQQHLLLRLNLPKVTVLADDRFYAERYLKLIRGLQEVGFDVKGTLNMQGKKNRDSVVFSYRGTGRKSEGEEAEASRIWAFHVDKPMELSHKMDEILGLRFYECPTKAKLKATEALLQAVLENDVKIRKLWSNTYSTTETSTLIIRLLRVMHYTGWRPICAVNGISEGNYSNSCIFFDEVKEEEREEHEEENLVEIAWLSNSSKFDLESRSSPPLVLEAGSHAGKVESPKKEEDFQLAISGLIKRGYEILGSFDLSVTNEDSRKMRRNKRRKVSIGKLKKGKRKTTTTASEKPITTFFLSYPNNNEHGEDDRSRKGRQRQRGGRTCAQNHDKAIRSYRYEAATPCSVGTHNGHLQRK